MPSLSIDLIYAILWTLTGLLTLIFMFLLGYTFWTRVQNKYWNSYRRKFRDSYGPKIFAFLEGNAGQSEADALINELNQATRDLSFFLAMLKEMIEIVKGEEREKLNILIEHPRFIDFFQKKLFSRSKRDQLKGCKYFKYTSAVKGRVAARLITISKSTNLVVAYCATKALQSSENLSIRQNGLIRFLKRDDVSDLMVNDLLHYFHRDNVAYYDEIGKSLKNICYDESITAEKKKVITLYMADHNFFSQADFLLNSLEKREYNRANAPVITGLIEALGRLHVKEAAPLIKEYLNTAETSLQITCVRALGRLGGEENLLFLLNSILRFDFTVRKEIIKVLVNNSEAGIPLLLQFLDVNQKFVSYSRDQSELTIEMEELIRKIRSTARGIRILLPAKVVNSHG